MKENRGHKKRAKVEKIESIEWRWRQRNKYIQTMLKINNYKTVHVLRIAEAQKSQPANLCKGTGQADRNDDNNKT